MLVLDSPYTDPGCNIAAEEYLLKNTEGDYAFFYINEPSLIIGKHQNAYAEINLDYVRRNNIPVIRRISGGGTVWHDPGNLNFSFILNGEEGRLVNFREYAQPVVDFLRSLGADARFGARNEILIGRLKVSGNAEHVHRKRVLHHGTLLFDADLDALSRSLGEDPQKYEDRAVRSIPGEVANIRELTGMKTGMEGFRSSLLEYLLCSRSGSVPYELDSRDMREIEKLAREKYGSWAWNFGYSPRYRLRREFELDGKGFSLDLQVEKGIIARIRMGSGNITGKKLERLENRLTGVSHDPDIVGPICRKASVVKPGLTDNFVHFLF